MRICPLTSLLLAFVLAIVMATPALAADNESYYIGSRSGSDVYVYPRTSAEKLGHLKRKTDVKVLEKRRGWWKVKTSGLKPEVSGWVYQSTVNKRYQATTTKKSSFFSGFSSLFRSSEPQQKTAVLGVRGLEEEGGATRKADAKAREAVKWMDSLIIKNRDVAAFIEEGDLNP